MNYFITLNVEDNETGELISRIEAYSLESLQEQLVKAENSIKGYERENSEEIQSPKDEDGFYEEDGISPHGENMYDKFKEENN